MVARDEGIFYDDENMGIYVMTLPLMADTLVQKSRIRLHTARTKVKMNCRLELEARGLSNNFTNK
jgi:hypothetical protein